MANPPEIWTFAVANLIAVGLGSAMTVLSLYAYVQNERATFRDAAFGFATLTFGMAIEPIYQLGVRDGYHPGGRELLALQTAEGIILSAGLGLLFYSIYRHDGGEQQTHTRVDVDPSSEETDP